MSIFNAVVPLNKATGNLLILLEWGSEKYPILGRIRYVYIDKSSNCIVLLLKDGPNSWTTKEERESVINQFTSHHLYSKHEVYEKDPVYFYVYFKIDETIKAQTDALLKYCASVGEDIISDPMDLFNLAMERISTGVITESESNLAKEIENKIIKEIKK